MDKDALVGIGLSSREAEAYIALLQLEEALASGISKKTGEARPNVYDTMKSLMGKGLVTYVIKNNRKYFRAASPSKLQDFLNEKGKMLSSALPGLLAMHKQAAKKPAVEVLEGREGLKTILNDVLRQKKEWFAFNVPGKGPEVLGPLVHAFEKERQKTGIPLKVIVVKTKQGLKRGKEFSEMKYTHVGYMPETYASPASNWIYGDRIVIIYWSKELPFAIRITDSRLAESYRNYFNAVWKAAEKG